MEAGLHAKDLSFIKWFENLSMDGLPLVGGKTASLGEMYSNLIKLGIEVPYGFAITTEAYLFFIKENKLEDVVNTLLDSENFTKESLRDISLKIQLEFLKAKIPKELAEQIILAFKELKNIEGESISVAVRSSATVEDLPEASFAGLHESFLNIKNEEQLLQKCKECFASLYTERAVSYRQDKKITQTKAALSICVQKMTRSDLACSGVMFTIDTESGFENAIVINASWGLGENIVKGVVNPDDYIVFKNTLENGFCPILQKRIGGKEFKLIYNETMLEGDSETLQNVQTSPIERNQFCLTDSEIITLSKWGLLIERHYSKLKNKKVPMDIEWAKDGLNGKIYILQARPETVHSAKNNLGFDIYTFNPQGPILLTGDSIGNLIGSGKVRVIYGRSDLLEFKDGEVLVAEKTEPDWEPYLKKSSAIITDRGGRTCHAAIVSRELGIPAIVGTLKATEVLKTGQLVTIACNFGSRGHVYEGILPFEHKTISYLDLPKTKTKIMMNLSNPTTAFKSSFIPNDGVGLLRMEFIITSAIKIHPMALIHPEKIKDPEVLNKINALIHTSSSKKHFYIDQLSQGIAMIAAAFFPKKVILRLSDFKSDEYRNLIGGEYFETYEENPMIGFRGASRYYDEAFSEAFELECQAIKKVREEMGLVNLSIMVPFCRTLIEGKKVIESLKKNGLHRENYGLEIYVMCEIPSNALLAEEFCEVFDGFSIGSNDLTQLTLGVDRNSSKLSTLFSENDPSVLKLIEMAISGAHKKNKKIGICGQRPSDDLEFAKFLVEKKIDSISLNPDSVVKVTEAISLFEIQKDEKRQ